MNYVGKGIYEEIEKVSNLLGNPYDWYTDVYLQLDTSAIETTQVATRVEQAATKKAKLALAAAEGEFINK